MKRFFKYNIIVFSLVGSCFFVFSSNNSKSGFGLTNFIIGADTVSVFQAHQSEKLKKYLQISCATDPVARAFFSPDDDVQKVLRSLIACEQESIDVAIFLLTDHKIVKALEKAQKRGVKVALIADKICCRGKFCKIDALCQTGIDLFVYDGKTKDGSQMSNIMHNKFVIFRKNIFDKSILWTGSFNFTNSARFKNQENVVLVDNAELIEKYVRQFEELKKRSVSYQKGMFRGVEHIGARDKKSDRKENRSPSGLVKIIVNS